MKKLVLAALAVLLVSGCSVLQTVEDSPLAAQLVVQQAALRVIDEDTVRAQRVVEIVVETRPYVDEGSITLAMLDQAVRAQIEWERLALADRLLLEAVLDQARADMELRFGAGVLDPEARASVVRVFDWIEDAATMVIEYRG